MVAVIFKDLSVIIESFVCRSVNGGGGEYEWEHGARVRNCTQLHWTLDAAAPRQRRHELIPRAKLKPPAQHNNM